MLLVLLSEEVLTTISLEVNFDVRPSPSEMIYSMASTEPPISESTVGALIDEWTTPVANSTQSAASEDTSEPTKLNTDAEKATELATVSGDYKEGTSESNEPDLSFSTSDSVTEEGTSWTTETFVTDSLTTKASTDSFVTSSDFTSDYDSKISTLSDTRTTGIEWTTETQTDIEASTERTKQETSVTELATSERELDTSVPVTDSTETNGETSEITITTVIDQSTTGIGMDTSPSETVTVPPVDITSPAEAATSPFEDVTIGETGTSEAMTDSTDFDFETTQPSSETETTSGAELSSTKSETRTIESETNAVTTGSDATSAFTSESAETTESEIVTSVSEEATSLESETTVSSTEDGTAPETTPPQGATQTDFSDFSTADFSNTTVSGATEVFGTEDDSSTTEKSETTTSSTTTQEATTTQETTTAEPTTTTSQRTTSDTEPVQTTEPPSGVCDDGFFGHECAYQCNCFDPDEVCNHFTGHCQSGCQTGFEGPGCLIESSSSGVDELVIIMGTLAGIFFLALIVVIILFCCLRKNKTKKAERATVLDDNMDFVALNMLPSQDPFKEIKAYVPRLKSEDAQIFDEFLGDGRFGPIYRGILHEENNTKTVAYKALKDEATQREKKAFYAQMELYSSFERHDNVLGFYGVTLFADRVFGGYEYAEHETLKFYLRRVHKGSIKLGTGESVPTDADVRDHLVSLGLDVATGMRHLASRGIVHRELAAKHVMVDSNHVAKIAGLNSLKGAMPMSQRWMAPEVIESNMNTLKSDVWSYGIVLWEVMNQCQHRPYTEMGSQDVLRFISAGNRLKRPPGCEKAVFSLMKWCWTMEPDKRPDFVRVVDALKEILYSGEHGNKAQRMGSFLNMADSKDIELSLEDSLPLTSASPNGSTLKAVTPSISAANSVNASPALKSKHKGEDNLAFTPDSAV